MKKIYHLSVFLLVWSVISGCWELSPNQVFDNTTPRELNQKNINRLASLPQDDTITIAFVGDSQRFYDQVEQFVQKANTLASIDFVILAGDITDFGLLKEYKLIDRMLSKLDKPYISVIGNHDVLAHGEEVYKHMFGPTDFSFVYRDVKFIMHNTNGREYPEGNVPDMTWLKQEFADDDMAKFYIAVSHIPPFDPDFDSTLVQPYTELLSNRSNVLVSLHGHIHKHKDGYPYEDGVRYITSYSFEQKSFLLLQIVNGELIKTIIDY